jgi:hypothetical protein
MLHLLVIKGNDVCSERRILSDDFAIRFMLYRCAGHAQYQNEVRPLGASFSVFLIVGFHYKQLLIVADSQCTVIVYNVAI